MSANKKQLPRVIVSLGLAAGIAALAYSWYFRALPSSALRLLEEIPPPAKNDRILVFTPHPDDETLACGAYLAAAVQNGASVWIVLVTDGNKHGQEKLRYQEFKNATSTLGVPETGLVFLGYPDGGLKRQDPRELERRFAELISQVKPDIVFAPHPLDHHPDHKTVGKLVAQARAGKNITLYQYLVHHNLFPRPKKFDPDLYLLPPLRMYKPDGFWKKFLLSQELVDTKLAAVLRYKSQLHDRRDPFLRTLLLAMVRQNELFASP